MFDPFEAKILLQQKNMWLEVIKIIKPFLEFLKSFDVGHVHNMVVIMLDPCFKALHIVEKLVGCGYAIQLASKYDVKVVVPFLMVCFDRLNPTTITSVIIVYFAEQELELEEDMFSVGFQ
jgi:hypothetical protein